MTAALRVDQFTGAPVLSRADKRRHLKLVVSELQRREQLRTTPAELHPKQRIAFESTATEIMYGGAAGGGKSHLFRRAAITWCQMVPGLQVYIFRREFADLYKNHMESSTGFPVMLGDLIDAGLAKIAWAKNQIRFKNGPKGTYDGGSVIHLCHCQYEKDVMGYQGAEIHVLMIDELTQWTRDMYTYLRGRVRLGGLKMPKWLKGLGQFPRILTGANPGGIGHNWVKKDFVDIAPEQTITRVPKSEGGMLRQFIRALLQDNPSTTENDPDYEDRLEGLGNPALVRAMKLGDWDIVSGGFFDDLWDRSKHVLDPFEIPQSWRIDRTFDWGSSKPFSVGWWAESDGSPATMANGTTRHFARGSLFRIAEWYGCDPKKPNEGLKLLAVDIAKGINEREATWRDAYEWHVEPGAADSSIYDTENGNCIADDMEAEGVTWLLADKSPGSRKNGWEGLRKYLKRARDNPREEPGMFVFSTCTDFIRIVPVLPRDAKLTDDVDTKAEDHIGDETRYRVLEPKAGAWGTSTFSSGQKR